MHSFNQPHSTRRLHTCLYNCTLNLRFVKSFNQPHSTHRLHTDKAPHNILILQSLIFSLTPTLPHFLIPPSIHSAQSAHDPQALIFYNILLMLSRIFKTQVSASCVSLSIKLLFVSKLTLSIINISSHFHQEILVPSLLSLSQPLADFNPYLNNFQNT